MTDLIHFENWLCKKWHTSNINYDNNGDIIINKPFVKNHNTYYITSRFTKHGDFCWGYLADVDGFALVNGRGFDVYDFIKFIELAFKSL